MRFPHFCVLLFCACIISCTPNLSDDANKPDDSATKPDPVAVFTLSELPELDPATALPSGGTVKLALEWSESWTAVADKDWLTATPASGDKGKCTISLTTAPNDDTHAREATLTVSSENGTAQVTVRQHPNCYNRTYKCSRKVNWSFCWIYDKSANMARSRILMPFPKDSEYQSYRDRVFDQNLLRTSPEGVKYLISDQQSPNCPKSGESCLEQSFTVDYYDVRVDFSLIEDRNLPYDKDSDSYKRYTKQIRDENNTIMIDPEDSRIIIVSRALWEESGEDRIEYARLCHKWIIDNIQYGIFDGPNSINDILSRMQGDCGNQHAVWMSLMRAAGIPARPIVMKAPDPDGYSHVRAEFYIPGYGWIPVDPTNEQGTGEDYFGAFKYEPLVVMNNDFAFTGVDRNNKKFIVGMLQGLSVVIWGSGDYEGQEHFDFVD